MAADRVEGREERKRPNGTTAPWTLVGSTSKLLPWPVSIIWGQDKHPSRHGKDNNLCCTLQLKHSWCFTRAPLRQWQPLVTCRWCRKPLQSYFLALLWCVEGSADWHGAVPPCNHCWLTGLFELLPAQTETSWPAWPETNLTIQDVPENDCSSCPRNRWSLTKKSWSTFWVVLVPSATCEWRRKRFVTLSISHNFT